jgi:putative tricarboxylic transport membrane protein
LRPKAMTLTTMVRDLGRRRDFYAGGLMVLFGLVMAGMGPSYNLGTLMHMGPGFLPTCLGVILILLGIAIAGAATVGTDTEEESILPEHPQWLGWACILAGPLSFIIVGTYLGLAPATFSCVFVSALGDKTATWKSSLVLALVVTVMGVALFSYLLQVPMPVFEWRGRW